MNTQYYLTSQEITRRRPLLRVLVLPVSRLNPTRQHVPLSTKAVWFDIAPEGRRRDQKYTHWAIKEALWKGLQATSAFRNVNSISWADAGTRKKSTEHSEVPIMGWLHIKAPSLDHIPTIHAGRFVIIGTNLGSVLKWMEASEYQPLSARELMALQEPAPIAELTAPTTML